MLAGIIRSFLTMSFTGSLVLGGLTLGATQTSSSSPPAETFQAASAMAFVTHGDAFPLIIRDLESVAQLRDVIQTLDGPPSSEKDIRKNLAAIGISTPPGHKGLLEQAQFLLEKTRCVLNFANHFQNPENSQPARTALDRFDALFADETLG
ncbi:MAG TPA: hypothetical protein DCW68_07110 [Rhodospirillaceae bacterium]|nr:MAG: hypothetical protein A2018_06620 [Alphaproteobacteria bacterium GWF2_58_20]HAU29857.1 hypothetical protein [Rhodospirillaceae bacterium]